MLALSKPAAQRRLVRPSSAKALRATSLSLSQHPLRDVSFQQAIKQHARSLSVSTTQKAPNPPYGRPPPGGGFPGGMPNIFGGGQEKQPGETLKENSIDLTELAEQNKLDPTIGRDEEIKRVIQILGRRGKNNPVSITKYCKIALGADLFVVGIAG